MSLKEYRKKRTFSETPEPSGRTRTRPRSKHPIFVVQKHEAKRLHYDFRLEIGGVLASWAIPKGPSLNTAERRLAMQTEDHPIEYASFEGVIPEGQYGAGTVMIWDMGTFETEPDGEAEEQLERGELKFRLEGEKLHGGFALIRSAGAGEKRWFLIKRKDEYADRSWKTDCYPRSALTDRTMEEIASGKRRVKLLR